MRRILLPAAALVATAALLTGCAGATSTDYAIPPQSEMAPEGASFDSSAGGEIQLDRQVITTGWVTVKVDSPLDAATEAVRITERAGGRVDARTEYAPRGGDQGSAQLTLRVPADDLTPILDQLKALGEVQEVSLGSNDVTMQTQDLDARITALRASIDRLLALVGTADTTEALIALETAVSDRQAELESLEAQRRYLSDQVAMSTITLNLVTEQVVPAPEPGSFLDGLKAGWDSFVAFFAGLLVVLGVLVPWLVLAGIITLVVVLLVRRRRRRKAAAAAAGAVTAPADPAQASAGAGAAAAADSDSRTSGTTSSP